LVVGTGGFASGPLLYVASKKNIPTLIQEQNSYAGITNKWLARSVDRVCVAYKHMERFFPASKIRLTGNPIRKKLLNINCTQPQAIQSIHDDATKKTLLVLGGSLGARRINDLIENQLDFFKQNNIQIVWQCGKFYIDQYKHLESDAVKIVAFINDMDVVYAAADIIISRAGASAVSELCVVGKPVIFIPSPNVSEDHQTKNAMALVKNQAAEMVKESDLQSRFQSVFLSVLNDSNKSNTLKENIKKMALPDATSTIVNEIELLLP
jgi:UDP-N-acetylglucosamine--N-acetylmuramyl-(pentapeptide) pyrophosphoryl-undecaprenol N-acetylglucosamine transferase